MSLRPCLETGCPTLTRTPRCPACTRAADRARGTRQERGYGAEHDKLRAQWAPIVATGRVKCARCDEPIPADAPWDLGHHDLDRSRYTGPEHAACNRATNGRKTVS